MLVNLRSLTSLNGIKIPNVWGKKLRDFSSQCKIKARYGRMILKTIKAIPFSTAVDLQKQNKDVCKVDVSAQTIRNDLHRYNLHARVLRKKPFMGPFPFEIRRLKFQPVSCLHCIAVFEQLSLN